MSALQAATTGALSSAKGPMSTGSGSGLRAESTSSQAKLTSPLPSQSVSDRMLGAYYSPTGQNIVMGAQAALAMGGAAAGALATGAGAVAALAAAGTALAAVAVGMLVGAAAAYIVDYVGADFFLNLFGLAAMPPNPSDTPAVISSAVFHSGSLLGALLTVAVVVVAAAAAVALTVLTGGLAGVLIGAAAAGAIGGAGGAIAGMLGQGGSQKGEVIAGSPNVFFEGKKAARQADAVICSESFLGLPWTKHSSKSPVVAEGCRSVYVNNQPLARVGHKTTCGGSLSRGVKSVAATLENGASLPISSEVPAWLRWTIVALDWIPIPKGNRRRPSPPETLPPKYTRNADGSVNGPRGGNYTPTGKTDANGNQIFVDRTGNYRTLNGKNEPSTSPHQPNDVQARYQHHNAKVQQEVQALRDQGIPPKDIATEVTFRDPVTMKSTRPDIVYRDANGDLQAIEVKTGNAEPSTNQALLADKLESGDLVPRGQNAKDFGLNTNQTLADQTGSGLSPETKRHPGINE